MTIGWTLIIPIAFARLEQKSVVDLTLLNIHIVSYNLLKETKQKKTEQDLLQSHDIRCEHA